MYLGDAEVEMLCANALAWLKPDGYFFFRESCFRPSGDRKRTGYNPTHYRDPRHYRKTCESLRFTPESGPDAGELCVAREIVCAASLGISCSAVGLLCVW
jgi:phosphoethanolamine N-methyltransferase